MSHFENPIKLNPNKRSFSSYSIPWNCLLSKHSDRWNSWTKVCHMFSRLLPHQCTRKHPANKQWRTCYGKISSLVWKLLPEYHCHIGQPNNGDNDAHNLLLFAKKVQTSSQSYICCRFKSYRKGVSGEATWWLGGKAINGESDGHSNIRSNSSESVTVESKSTT